MATVAAIIQQAMETAQIHGADQSSTSTDENTLGMKYLNDILELWSLDGLAIYDQATISHTLTAGDGEYTIAASGADITSARPTRVLGGYVRLGTTDYPLRVRTLGEYDAIVDKSIRGIPENVYYDAEFPSGKVFLWPLPDAGYTMVLRVRQALTSYSSSATEVSVPPGYKAALVYALAVALCPVYGKTPDPVVMGMAERSYALIKHNNRTTPRIRSDLSGGREYDITTDR